MGGPSTQGAPLARLTASAGWPLVTRQLSRPAVFAAIACIGFANGVSEIVLRSIWRDGVVRAMVNTFDVSIILWAACAGVVYLLVRSPDVEWQRGDILAASIAATLVLLPIPAAAWLALFALALQLRRTATASSTRRAATLLMATTVPLFWARIAFAALSDRILSADAWLVGHILDVQPVGNALPLPDGSGWMFIAPACSSLTNLSYALLGAILFVTMRSGMWSARSVAWTIAGMVAVVAINVARMGMIGLYPAHYDLLHGEVGATVAGWLTMLAILAIGHHRIGVGDARQPG